MTLLVKIVSPLLIYFFIRRLEFSRLATEQTSCNNAMARMLVPAI